MNHLFISDLDGTLLNNNQTISQESIAILNDLINQGLQFTIATARSFDSASKLLEEIQFNLPSDCPYVRSGAQTACLL